ncbi:hypothetical protein EVAR_97287_1 [Eumeta japonica]|uniref:Uncharacterized protein n=1 Tax=Eumeta variegata TaxID=151549 RepID=A0A4C1XI38_EUMVA|nr:hypothetical protein EVAR_97287_1 [Eumeta japonica]
MCLHRILHGYRRERRARSHARVYVRNACVGTCVCAVVDQSEGRSDCGMEIGEETHSALRVKGTPFDEYKIANLISNIASEKVESAKRSDQKSNGMGLVVDIAWPTSKDGTGSWSEQLLCRYSELYQPFLAKPDAERGDKRRMWSRSGPRVRRSAAFRRPGPYSSFFAYRCRISSEIVSAYAVRPRRAPAENTRKLSNSLDERGVKIGRERCRLAGHVPFATFVVADEEFTSSRLTKRVRTLPDFCRRAMSRNGPRVGSLRRGSSLEKYVWRLVL